MKFALSQEVTAVADSHSPTPGLFDKVNELLVRTSAAQDRDQLFAHLTPVTEASPALLSYVDAAERYVYVNRAYELFFGRPREEIIGKRLDELLSPDRYQESRPF